MNSNKSSTSSLSKQSHQGGFVLLAVLVVSIVLVSLVSIVTLTIEQRIITVSQLKNQAATKMELAGVQAQVSYLLSTQQMAVNGLVDINELENSNSQFSVMTAYNNAIRTDGESAQLFGSDVSIQNQWGLIPFNSAQMYWLKHALDNIGLSNTRQNQLIDTLVDYLDRDNWQEPLGDELASHRNFLLQNCLQLHELKYWNDDALQDLNTMCSVSRWPAININTLPLPLWEMLWPQSAQAVRVQRANNQWFLNESMLAAIEPEILNHPPEYLQYLGGTRFIIIVSKHDTSLIREVEIGIGENIPFTNH